ncbi:uncharacterized protein [Nicotiana tomentosiformis]|uniref:uncharacterized protein n=1 Tax=Nicotiana tomentosiformis TaxID=4098 RepID=UPI00388C69A1
MAQGDSFFLPHRRLQLNNAFALVFKVIEFDQEGIMQKHQHGKLVTMLTDVGAVANNIILPTCKITGDDILLNDKKEAKKLRMQTARYSLLHNDLYKRTYGGPLAKCLGPNQTPRILEEVHEGHYGAHFGDRALVMCLLRAGALFQICEQEVITFIWRNVICRFSLSKEISYDNESQFTGRRTAEFFEKWHIKRILSTPYHLAGNGKMESFNKTILKIMKKKLEEAKGLWPEILPEVLWAHIITPKKSIGETPYSLVYGTEAVIPVEVRDPSLRYSHESGTSKDENIRKDLDKVEERRDMALIRMVAQK